MNGSVVWITGASAGIGAALAREMNARGATLVVTARRQDRLEELRASCADPTRVHLLAADLRDLGSLPGLASEAERFEGRLDVLVNNAGVSQRAQALRTTLPDVRSLMELNFIVPVALTTAVLPGMLERRRGRVVVMSSVAGYVGTPMRSAYAASKHALRGYFDSLRAELAGCGVGVTVACPGYVRTEISENAIGEGGLRHGQRDRVIERGISAEACARQLADGIERGRSELHIGGVEVLAIYAKRWLPGIVERVVPGQAPA